MVYVKKGSGKPLVSSETNSSIHIQRYASVCKALRTSNLPIDSKQTLSEALLASLTAQLFEHYQEYYGRTSPKPRPITIPASKLFSDYESDGALYVMLSTLLVGATVRDLTPLDKLFTKPVASLLPLLHEIDKNLALYGFTSTPKIFLNTVPIGLIHKLSKIAVEHGGELVSAEEQATHVIDWNDDIDNNPLYNNTTNSSSNNNNNNNIFIDEHNARVVDVKTVSDEDGSYVYLVHWPGLPDSANEWLPESGLSSYLSASEQQQALAIASHHRSVSPAAAGVRHYVACRYLLDVDVYNEWGQESDYDASGLGGLGQQGQTGSAMQIDNGNNEEDSLLLPANATSTTPSATRKGVKGRGRRTSSSSTLNNPSNTNNSNSNNNATNGSNGNVKEWPTLPLATGVYEKLFADVLPASLTRSIFQGHVSTARVLEVDYSGARLSVTPATSTNTTATNVNNGNLSKVSSQANLSDMTNTSSNANNAANLSSAEAKEAETTTTAATTTGTTNNANNTNNNDQQPQQQQSDSNNGKKRKFDQTQQQSGSVTDTPFSCPPLKLRMDTVSAFEEVVLGYVIQSHRPHGVSSYLQLRNGMLQLYLARPHHYLSATECRRKLAGDVARLTRIHEFLDCFGAINYLVKAEARPHHSSSSSNSSSHAVDFALSHRRRHLVDRLTQHYPTCSVHAFNSTTTTGTGTSTAPGTSATNASATGANKEDSNNNNNYATARWSQAMDAQLCRIVRDQAMDWNSISRAMTSWLDSRYDNGNNAATANSTAIATTIITATITATTSATNSSSEEDKRMDEDEEHNNNDSDSGNNNNDSDNNHGEKKEEEKESGEKDETAAATTATVTATTNDNDKNDNNASSGEKEEEEDAGKERVLRGLSRAQRHSLVTPLLCMLRFMEMQMRAVVRSVRPFNDDDDNNNLRNSSSNNSNSSNSNTAAANTGSDTKVETVSTTTTNNNNSNTSSSSSSSSSSSGGNSRGNSSSSSSDIRLFLHPASLLLTPLRPPPPSHITTTTSSHTTTTSKVYELVTRVSQAVTHLAQLDLLLHDWRQQHNTYTYTTTTNNNNNDNDDNNTGEEGKENEEEEEEEENAVSMDVEEPSSIAGADNTIVVGTNNHHHNSSNSTGDGKNNVHDSTEVCVATQSMAQSLVSQLQGEIRALFADLRHRQTVLLRESLQQRLAIVEDKLRVLHEVDTVLQCERDQLEHDKRAFAWQRLLHHQSNLGLTLTQLNPNNPHSSTNSTNNNNNNNSMWSVNNSHTNGNSNSNQQNNQGLSTSGSLTGLVSLVPANN